MSFVGEASENATVRKSIRLTPSAYEDIKKWMHIAYYAHQEGILQGEQMKDENLQAFVNFSFDCARWYLTQLAKKVK